MHGPEGNRTGCVVATLLAVAIGWSSPAVAQAVAAQDNLLSGLQAAADAVGFSSYLIRNAERLAQHVALWVNRCLLGRENAAGVFDHQRVHAGARDELPCLRGVEGVGVNRAVAEDEPAGGHGCP
mgnify:CR=1 FL=1